MREEIQAEALVRNLGGYARLLELVAAASGTILNVNALCRDAGVSYETTRRYMSIIEDTLVGFQIPAYRRRGHLWPRAEIYHYRTKHGLEVDFVLEVGRELWAITSLFLSGLAATVPATAELEVEPPPVFSKSFSPDLITAGGVSTLVFTIDNTGSSLAAASLDFTDNLPASLAIASPANASTDCTGGVLTAAAGTGVVSYTGGTVAASSSCSVQVDVTAAIEGEYLNVTEELTSSSGASGTASAVLTVGFIFADGFESGDVSAWSSSEP